MGRFYAELSITIYADTESAAEQIAELARGAIQEKHLDEVGDVTLVSVDEDEAVE